MTGMPNLPDDPDLAIAAGRKLCERLLEPLQATFGRLAIRSAYRSPEVNAYGNAHFQNCGSNERNRARHIWDQRSKDGGMGAMTSIIVPWLVDQLDKGVSWQGMAWWIHDHLSFFRNLPRSISAGMSCRGAGFRASRRRAAYSRNPDFRTMMGIIATSIAASRRLLSRSALAPARRARRFQSGSGRRPSAADRSPAMRRMISASGAHNSSMNAPKMKKPSPVPQRSATAPMTGGIRIELSR